MSFIWIMITTEYHMPKAASRGLSSTIREIHSVRETLEGFRDVESSGHLVKTLASRSFPVSCSSRDLSSDATGSADLAWHSSERPRISFVWC